MIDRQKGKYVFQCDTCFTTLETKERDFSTALDILKSEGWIGKKNIYEQWEHFCPKCG